MEYIEIGGTLLPNTAPNEDPCRFKSIKTGRGSPPLPAASPDLPVALRSTPPNAARQCGNLRPARGGCAARLTCAPCQAAQEELDQERPADHVRPRTLSLPPVPVRSLRSCHSACRRLVESGTGAEICDASTNASRKNQLTGPLSPMPSQVLLQARARLLRLFRPPEKGSCRPRPLARARANPPHLVALHYLARCCCSRCRRWAEVWRGGSVRRSKTLFLITNATCSSPLTGASTSG